MVAGSPRRLVIDRQPLRAEAGVPFSEPLAVHIGDICGNLIMTADRQISASLSINSEIGFLRGETTVTSSAGAAQFRSLAIDRAGPGYALRVEATGLDGDTSAPFEVVPGPAARYALTGPRSAVVGTSATFRIVVQDIYGNEVPSYHGMAALTVSDSRAEAPGVVLFDAGTQAQLAVTFRTIGMQTVAIKDVANRSIEGSITVEVTAPVRMNSSGGCSSGGGAGAMALLGIALAGRRLRRGQALRRCCPFVAKNRRYRIEPHPERIRTPKRTLLLSTLKIVDSTPVA